MTKILRSGLCLLALTLTCCSGSTKTGNPYSMKADRELEAYLPGDLKTVHATAEKVLRETFNYRIVSSGADRREGIIEARTTKGDAVRVETYRSTERVTRTEVYVGPLGDEDAMRDVLEEISAALKRPSPAPPADS